MSRRRDLDLLRGEKVDMIIKPHPLSFINYHVFFVFLILSAFFLHRAYLLSERNISLLSALSFLNVIFGKIAMNLVDGVFLVSFWIVLIISGWMGRRLLRNGMLMVYTFSVAALGTIVEVYLYITQCEIGFIQRSFCKLVLLTGTALACIVLVEVYRRRRLYILTNHRIIARWGLTLNKREITYRDISRVYVKQGMLGRIFNYGTVVLDSTFDFDLSGFPYKEIPSVLKIPYEEDVNKSLKEASFKSQRRKRRLLLLGVPNPRRVRIIIGNRLLEAKEHSL